MKIVFMGTSPFAVPTLAGLFEDGYPLVGVITQPDRPAGRGRNLQSSPVKQRAFDLHLPVYQPETLRNNAARGVFEALGADLLVVVAYGKILPSWLLQLPRFGAINLHASLLPKYRGAAPVQWAIAHGATETGVCTMQLDEGLDTGPVYLCEKTSVDPEETAQELSDRLARMGSKLVARTVDGVLNGSLEPLPQDHTQATLAPILKKQDGYINWQDPSKKIHDRVRAFTPWPGALSRFRNSLYKVLKTRVDGRADAGGEPGTIFVSRGRTAVCCGDSMLLEILELQAENRQPVAGVDFANGARIQPGEKFQPVIDN